MASTSSVGGLVSGLDTKTIVDQLVALAANTQTRLKQQVTANTNQNSAAQGINTKAASMTSAAKDLAAAKTFTTASASSSNAAATASVTGSPAASSITFSVTQMATAARYSTGTLTFPSSVTSSDTFSITRGSDTWTVKQATNAADLVKNINESGADVLATVTTDANGGQRLVLTSKTTGAVSDFSTSGLSGSSSGGMLSAGGNAEVNLGNGLTLTSKTNTFKNLIDGVDVTLSGDADGKPITVTTAVSKTGINDKISGLVGAMNTVLQDVAFHTKALAQGATASLTKGSILAGNNIIRSVSTSILDAVNSGTGDQAAALAGIGVQRDGTVTFDSAAFSKLYDADPAKAQKVISTLADAVQKAGDAASNAQSGSLTSFINGNTSENASLTTSISAWDTRLASKRDQLTRQFSAMETALSRMNSQMTSLTQAISSLPGFSNNN